MTYRPSVTLNAHPVCGMHTPPLTRLLCLLALIAFHGSAWAEWPQFRGPTGQGHSDATTVPLQWGPEKNVVWKQSLPGLGWSSPVVSGNRIYVTTAVSDSPNASGTLSLRLLCLDATAGQTLWNREVFQADGSSLKRSHRKNSQASPTPILEDDRIYVHFGHMGTACLDNAGNLLWRQSELDYSPVHGNGGSPILVENLLVFSADGSEDPFVAALDKRTGHVAWRTTRTEPDASKKFSFGTPLLIETDGHRQIISQGSEMVGAYDPKTGRELWKVRYDGYSVVPRPVFGHGLIFISTGFDRPVVLAIRPGGSGDVTDTHVVWTLGKGGPKTPSLLLVGDELFMVSDGGIASCVDARTGRVHWEERVGGNYSASPLYAAGRIYLQSEEGKGVVLRAGTRFEVLAGNELEERSLASYGLTDKGILIRTEHRLYLVGAP